MVEDRQQELMDRPHFRLPMLKQDKGNTMQHAPLRCGVLEVQAAVHHLKKLLGAVEKEDL